jgi:succinoglycan biosynthesis protein ExoM
MGTSPTFNDIHLSLAVCICTYQRPEGLRRLLLGLDRQVFSHVQTPDISLIVADNSPQADAREVVTGDPGQWRRYYLHEPHPGISHARNTALAAIPEGTDFIAMIDDDEVPAPDWLDQLLHTQLRSGADIVVGPTSPVFPPGTPDWVLATGFFLKPQNQHSLRELDPDPPAATCNVLMRASLFDDAAITFDPALSLSGGEDKMLFQMLKLRGHRFAWASSAHTQEYYPTARANLHYMWREAYRRGTVKYLVKRRLKSRSGLQSLWIAARLLGRSLVRIIKDLLLLLAHLGSGRQSWVPLALRVADSLGTTAGVLHIPNRHYRPEQSEC